MDITKPAVNAIKQIMKAIFHIPIAVSIIHLQSYILVIRQVMIDLSEGWQFRTTIDWFPFEDRAFHRFVFAFCPG